MRNSGNSKRDAKTFKKQFTQKKGNGRESLSKKLKQIKSFAEDYTSSFVMIVAGSIGIAVSAVSLFHGVAQWDLICTGRVWASAESNIGFYQNLISQGYWRYAELPFQDSILFRSTIGNGYDFFLMLIAIGWVLVLVSVVVLMLGVALFYRNSARVRTEEWNSKSSTKVS